MSKATHAIIKHSNTPENPIMKIALKTEILGADTMVILLLGQIITNQSETFLPPTVVAEIKPLFYLLGSKEFLASCEKGSTQNVNEAYHQLVWKLAPKE